MSTKRFFTGCLLILAALGASLPLILFGISKTNVFSAFLSGFVWDDPVQWTLIAWFGLIQVLLILRCGRKPVSFAPLIFLGFDLLVMAFLWLMMTVSPSWDAGGLLGAYVYTASAMLIGIAAGWVLGTVIRYFADRD